MKYLLLFMTVLQAKSFWRSFKNIFKSSKTMLNDLNNTLQEAEAKTSNKDNFLISMTIGMIIYGLFLTVYYLLACIYVGNLIFAILSSIYIIKTWQDANMALKYLDKRDNTIIQMTLWDRIFSLTYLFYIGYFIYYLVTTW